MTASKHQRTAFRTFIGIDLGGGRGKNTAVALLQRAEGDGVRVLFVGTKTADRKPFYDRQLLQFIEAHREHAVLAVDAPLTLTACVRCRLPRCVGLDACVDPTIDWFRKRARLGAEGAEARDGATKPTSTPYTQRACEVVLQQDFGVMPREALGQGMGPLTARARYLCRALEPHFELNRNLIEVYPKATIQLLFDFDRAQRYKREVNTWRTRAEMLEDLADKLRFEIWREGCLSNDHCFDAVVCAYTGYLWATQQWQLPTDDRPVFEQDGWIWVPPAPETSSSQATLGAASALKETRRRDDADRDDL